MQRRGRLFVLFPFCALLSPAASKHMLKDQTATRLLSDRTCYWLSDDVLETGNRGETPNVDRICQDRARARRRDPFVRAFEFKPSPDHT